MTEEGTKGWVVLDTTNKLDWTGHGGDHRSLQIAEALERAQLCVRLPLADAPTTFLERHLRGLALWSTGGHEVHYQPGERGWIHGRQAISNLGHMAKRYLNALAEAPRPCALLWECANSTLGPTMAERAGCPVVAVPENVYTIERGFRDSWRGVRGLAALRRELDFLRRCAAVFCISREEQWMLRLQGIDAGFLPYFPPRRLEEFLLEIRSRRRPHDARRFLLLGSAFHPPTGVSMEAHLQALLALPGASSLQIDVAGYGTERLRGMSTHSNVTLHGTIDQERLREILVATSAAIVHQRPSVGALSRIPELLLAGVPVIANVNASRSTWGLQGVIHYESLEELWEILHGPFPVPPAPERPVRAEERFARAVADISARRR